VHASVSLARLTPSFLLPAAQIIAHLPGKDVGGVYENSLDTAYMIFHSPLIGGLLAVDLLAINMFNAAGMRITSSLGAVFRSVLEAVRTLNVWLLDLALYYYFTNGTLGEAWSGQYSWLQACGFVVLVTSALTYGRGNMRAAAAAAAAADAVAEAEAPAAAEAGDAPAPAPQLSVRTLSGGQPNLPPVRGPCAARVLRLSSPSCIPHVTCADLARIDCALSPCGGTAGADASWAQHPARRQRAQHRRQLLAARARQRRRRRHHAHRLAPLRHKLLRRLAHGVLPLLH
jgi:hypothetical protein